MSDSKPEGSLKKLLHRYRRDVYRLRPGDYRVIYTYGDGGVTLLGVDDCRNIYKGDRLVAEEPTVAVSAIPDVEAWLTPVSESRASTPQHTLKRSAPDDLPVRITPDLLERLLLPLHFVEPLCVCRSYDDLLAIDMPEHLRDRIFDYISVPDFDSVLDQPSYVTGAVENLLRFKEGELSELLLCLSPEQDRYVTWGARERTDTAQRQTRHR